MLELAGVKRSAVEFVEAGGVMARFEALMQQKFDATLLVSPFDAAAEKKGFARLGSGLDTLGAYQGVVAAVRRRWAAENRDCVTGYIAAWREALALWEADEAHTSQMTKRPNSTLSDRAGIHGKLRFFSSSLQLL